MELKKQEELDEILTMKEVATYLKISIESVRMLIKKREMPYAKVGNQYRFSRALIYSWIENQSLNSLASNTITSHASAAEVAEFEEVDPDEDIL